MAPHKKLWEPPRPMPKLCAVIDALKIIVSCCMLGYALSFTQPTILRNLGADIN